MRAKLEEAVDSLIKANERNWPSFTSANRRKKRGQLIMIALNCLPKLIIQRPCPFNSINQSQSEKYCQRSTIAAPPNCSPKTHGRKGFQLLSYSSQAILIEKANCKVNNGGFLSPDCFPRYGRTIQRQKTEERKTVVFGLYFSSFFMKKLL